MTSSLPLGALTALALMIPSAPASAAPPARAPSRAAAPVAVETALPYTAPLITAGLTKNDDDALRSDIDRRLTRLLLDNEEAAVDRPDDLYALLVLAAEVDVLARRGEDTPAFRRAACAVAYLLHLVGTAYETRAGVRDALDALPEQVSAERRDDAEKLVDAVRRMRKVGSAWLARALPVAMDPAAPDPTLLTWRGLWREREGDPVEAAAAFALAFRKSQKSRHALHLYDALLAADRDDDAKLLEKRLAAVTPALAARVARRKQARQDARATAAYEAARGDGDVAAQLEQLKRYWRMGREGAALMIATALMAEHGDDAAVQHHSGALWLGTQRLEALQGLLARAAERGPLDDRLLELRVALAVRLGTPNGRRGGGDATAVATLEADLAQLAERGGERGRLLGHAARILLPLGRWQAEAAAGAEVAELGTVRQLEDAVAAGVKDLPRSREMRLLGLAAYVGLNRAEVGIKRLREGLEQLAPADRTAVALAMGEIEAGYAVRNDDFEALGRALTHLEELRDVDDAARPQWNYTVSTVRATREALGGRGIPDHAARVAFEGLPRPGMDFDGEDPLGRLWEGALAASRATLALLLGKQEEGLAGLTGMRRWAPGEPLAKLTAAQAQMMVGDVGGAWELLEAGLVPGMRPMEAFLYRKWRGVCAREFGEAALKEAEAREQLALWDAAKAPSMVGSKSPRSLFIGDFSVGLEVVPGEALKVTTRIAPIVVLVPDVPETKAEVRARAGVGAE